MFLSVFRAEFFLQHFPIRPLKYGSRFGHVFFQFVVLGDRGMFYFLLFCCFFVFFKRSSGNRITLLKTPERRSYAIGECIVSLHKISELTDEI